MNQEKLCNGTWDLKLWMNCMGIHTFPKGISPKVNVIARLWFELAFYCVVVHPVSHYATRTLQSRVDNI